MKQKRKVRAETYPANVLETINKKLIDRIYTEKNKFLVTRITDACLAASASDLKTLFGRLPGAYDGELIHILCNKPGSNPTGFHMVTKTPKRFELRRGTELIVILTSPKEIYSTHHEPATANDIVIKKQTRFKNLLKEQGINRSNFTSYGIFLLELCFQTRSSKIA